MPNSVTRVLVIDDDEGFGFLVRRDLERSGFTVSEATVEDSSEGSR